MNSFWKNFLLWYRPWYVRLWMMMALVVFIVFVVNSFIFTFISDPLHQMVMLAFSMGSFATYLLVYGFNWD